VRADLDGDVVEQRGFEVLKNLGQKPLPADLAVKRFSALEHCKKKISNLSN
jgi:hypothetical protein